MGFIKTTARSIKLDDGISLFQQTYEKTNLPENVVVVKLSVFADDQGGWFKENLRAEENGSLIALKEAGVDFKIKQSNMSLVAANGKRFWHIHPEKNGRSGQNEIWTTNGILLLGLVDLRKNSKTYGVKSKIVLNSEKAVYIPSGVAHGFFNPNNFPITLVYFADQHFQATEETQEHRIDPKELPYDFVMPEEM